MKRLAMQRLIHWKDAVNRKPMILRGVRQVGKTWLMTTFAKEFFPDNYHYFNFDLQPDLAEIFAASRSPDAIIESLAFVSSKPISPSSLLIFDEAQACPDAIHSLKYFCELRPDLRVLLAGSLLGLSLARPKSYPVGKVDFMTLEPMTFTEFLLAQDETALVELLQTRTTIEPLPEIFFKRLCTKLSHYELVGGMPEPVAAWCLSQDLRLAKAAQTGILQSYLGDIESHAQALDVPKIKRIWQSLSQQLSRENKQFRYSVVEPRSNARKYGDALQWLMDARITRGVHRIKTLGYPLSAYEEPAAFKAYFVDTGLLCRLARIDETVLFKDNPSFREMKGSLTENLVLQSLVCQYEDVPHYWARTNPSAEVDFLVQQRGRIIPIEVKSSTNISSPSLRKFKEAFGDQVTLRVRLSLRNLSLDGDILNIPLFMVDETKRLIDIALEKVL